MAKPDIIRLPSPVAKPAILEADPESIEIDLARTALIIIDMQNSFMTKGGLFDLLGWDISPSQKIIAPIQRIAKSARSKGVKVIYTASVFSEDLREGGGPNSPNWYKEASIPAYRLHPEWKDKLCFKGTWGGDIVDELKPQEGDIVVDKPRYSAFFGTNLDVILRTYNTKYLIFVGRTTNCCVEASIRDAFNLEYFSFLVSDAATNSGPPFVQDASLFNIKLVYGWVTNSRNLLKVLK